MGHLSPGREVAGLTATYRIEKALSGRVFAGSKDGEAVLLKEVHAGDPERCTPATPRRGRALTPWCAKRG
jgi:hypothetical protein